MVANSYRYLKYKHKPLDYLCRQFPLTSGFPVWNSAQDNDGDTSKSAYQMSTLHEDDSATANTMGPKVKKI